MQPANRPPVGGEADGDGDQRSQVVTAAQHHADEQQVHAHLDPQHPVEHSQEQHRDHPGTELEKTQPEERGAAQDSPPIAS